MQNYWLDRKRVIREKVGDKVLTFINAHVPADASLDVQEICNSEDIMMKIAEGYAPKPDPLMR